MAPPVKSDIWKYFTLVNAEIAKCKICNNNYSRKGRTNTSLKNHLKSKHPDQHTNFLITEIEKKEITKTADQGKNYFRILFNCAFY
jgi:uncharacterized membrane protein YcaP (DUF421 family)